MHIEIEMRIEMQGSARGRTTAPFGMPEDGLGATARSMAEQGS
jgi:hypothetical protein